MIDLRFGGLPSRIAWDGGSSPIRTSFRVWIEFDRRLREEGVAWFGIFEREPPEGAEWVPAALEFLRSPNQTPRAVRAPSGVPMLDMVLDGDYIVASFQQAYGIDLTDPDCDMHWHRFKALLDGLPDSTKLSRIMGYRSWDPQDAKRKHESVMGELRNAWALPRPETDDDEDGGFAALVRMYDM